MFSPYYARARRRAPHGAADPLNHCSLNVVLYARNGTGIGTGNGNNIDNSTGRGAKGGGASRWTMTERGRDQVQRSARKLQIGPSALHWDGDDLLIDIDEISVPWPARVRGTVRVSMARRFDRSVELAPGHRWSPIAPVARVDVDAGGHRWSGAGYLDSNQGDEPLEQAFRRWDWSRAVSTDGSCLVFYDVETCDRHDASPHRIGMRFHADGRIEPIEGPPRARLAKTLWRVDRTARSDDDASIDSLRTLTDAPFYARSVMQASWLGERVTVMHESLSLVRFAHPWVQAMLPFRMPRRAG